jgi:hypothetical protein
LDELLAGSSFTIAWQQFELTPWGRVRVHGIRLREGTTTLASVARVEVTPAWLDLLRGRLRADRVALTEPAIAVELDSAGKPEAWLRLREVVRRRRASAEPADDAGGLQRYCHRLSVHEGRASLKLTGRLAALGGGQELRGLAGELDLSATPQTFVATTEGAFGTSPIRATVTVADGRPAALHVQLATPLRLTPNWLSRDFLRGLTWTVAGARAAAGEVAVLDLQASEGEAAPLLKLGAVAWQQARQRVRLQQVDVHVSAAWLGQQVALPAEVTPWLAGPPIAASLTSVELARDGTQWQAEVVAATASVPWGKLALAQGRWRHGQITLERPEVSLAVAELERRQPRWAAKLQTLLDLGKAPESSPDLPVKPAKPVAPGERPAGRWQRQIHAAQAALARLHGKLEAAWPSGKLPAGVGLHLRDGALRLTGDEGALRLAFEGVGVDVDPGRPDMLQLRGRLVDDRGPIGTLGLRWQRGSRRSHVLDLDVDGRGMARLAQSLVPGLHVADNGVLRLLAQARVDAKRIQLDGRLDLDHVGIDWWRLSAKPIADFRASVPFQLELDPQLWSLRVADAEVGGDSTIGEPGARLSTTIDVGHPAGEQRIVVTADAPMQDCGAMLRAIPASLTPNIGRLDAHGVMGWHVGIATQLPQTGYVAVDLALGDTYCTFDGFEHLDLQELNGPFDRPVNESGKLLDDVHIGPASGSWTPLARMPVHVPRSMWSTEDPFFEHRGISESLLAKALAIDLTMGRFIYGGSTVTQQLVKNLYLKREKALSRKFEEMLIVWQMEKQVGKQRILELYCNGVEFGPKVYGITRAAEAFYQKTPEQLLPEEALYLAIIKPSPSSGYGTMRGNGWGDWYAEKMQKYMDKYLAEGLISQAEYDAAASRQFKPLFNPPPVRSGKSPTRGR